MHRSPPLLDETLTTLLSARLIDASGHDEAAVLAWCGTLKVIGAVFTCALPEIGPACRDPADDHVIVTVIASSFAFGIEGAGWDQAHWNDGSENFGTYIRA